MAAAQQADDVVLRNGEEVMEQSAKVEWLIQGVLPAKSRALLYGDSGVGKTNVGIDIGAHVASGKPWHGRVVKQGLVIYIASENAEMVGPRLKAWEAEHGGKAEWKRMCAEAWPFSIVETGIDLANPDSVTAVLAWIPSAALVIVDTLMASSDSGNLKDPDDFKRIISQINRIRIETGATVLVLAHERDDGRGAFGGSAPRGGFPVRYRLTRKGKDGKTKPEGPKFENGDTITLTCEKMSAAATPDPLKVKVRLVQVERGVKMPVIADTRAVKADATIEPRRKRKPRQERTRKPTQAEVWAECGGDVAEFAKRAGLEGNRLRTALSRLRNATKGEKVAA
jgi:hypothetical protein